MSLGATDQDILSFIKDEAMLKALGAYANSLLPGAPPTRSNKTEFIYAEGNPSHNIRRKILNGTWRSGRIETFKAFSNALNLSTDVLINETRIHARRENKVQIPYGFKDPEELAEGGGLRSRLAGKVQAYSGFAEFAKKNGEQDLEHANLDFIIKTISTLDKPFVIQGEGGLGKTRMALEISRRLYGNGYRPLLITDITTKEMLDEAIQFGRKQGQDLLLILDYIEDMGNGISFDELTHWINHNANLGSRLVVTTRNFASNDSGTGPRTLREPYCEFLNIGSEKLRKWRLNTCMNILKSNANVLPRNIFEELASLDNPAVATLVVHAANNQNANTPEKFNLDGAWLLKRLKLGLNCKVSDIEFVTLLALHPHDRKTRNNLSKNPVWKKVLNVLEQQGWSSRTLSDDPEWRLGHDLVSDIPLAGTMVSAKVQISEELEQSKDIAIKANAEKILARSLSRAIDRFFSNIHERQFLAAYQACIPPLALGNEKPKLAEKIANLTKYSLSLGMGEKVRILEELPNLSKIQIQQLEEVFTDEAVKFREFSVTHEKSVAQLVVKAASGDHSRMSTIVETYKLNKSVLENAENILFEPTVNILGQNAEFITGRGKNLERLKSLAQHPNKSIRASVIGQFHKLRVMQRRGSGLETLVEDGMRNAKKHKNPELAQQVILDTMKSLSLGLHEKARIVKELAMLSNIQIDALLKMFSEEKVKFQELAKKHPEDIARIILGRSGNDIKWKNIIGEPYIKNREVSKIFDVIWSNRKNTILDELTDILAKDDNDSIRESAVKEIYSIAKESVSLGESCTAFDNVIRFANDNSSKIRKISVIAKVEKLFAQVNQDKKVDLLSELQNAFKDESGSVREVAVSSAFQYISFQLKEGSSVSLLDEIFRFSGDEYEPVRKIVQEAQEDKAGWLIVRKEYAQAIKQAKSVLMTLDVSPTIRATMNFLIWLADPTETQKATTKAFIASLDKEAARNWTFDFFKDRIEELSASDKKFAKWATANLEEKTAQKTKTSR